jgi:peptidoglycan/xylan/chitin deacetylase (PgdA/CDA1 family)
MRRLVKNVVERVVVGGGVAALARARLRGRSLVLSYHDIVPDDHPPQGDRSLHLPRRSFVEQLDTLRRIADVVPLREAIRGGPDRGKPKVAITFDDAYRGAVRIGLEEVARRGLPATVFVCPGRLGGHAFWWDRYAPGTGLGDFRELALGEGRGREELVEALAGQAGMRARAVPEVMTTASLDELRAAVGAPGITLGAHTWSHPNLARATDEELEVELGDTARWLDGEFGGAYAPYLAYPYGLTRDRCAAVAARVGYEAGLRIEGGWFQPGGTDPFATPRLNVSAGLSGKGFEMRLSGLLLR